MKKIKRIAYLLAVFVLVLSCTACMKVDIGVQINEDETGSLTTKISIEESVYEALVSMEEYENNEFVGSFKAKDFQKEVIDGASYYSAEKTEMFVSYEELVKSLEEIELPEGSELFESVKIEKSGMKYNFTAKTAIISNVGIDPHNEFEETESEEPWIIVTITVSMPGIIKDTNGEKINADTTQFVINDFESNSEYYAYSSIPLAEAIIITVLLTGIVAFILFVHSHNKKKRGEEEHENPDFFENENEGEEKMKICIPLEDFEEYEEN